VGRVLVSRIDEADSSASIDKVPNHSAHQEIKRESFHIDSGAVVMEVENS